MELNGYCEKTPNRVHCMKRVSFLSDQLRMREILRARDFPDRFDGHALPNKIVSAIHDALYVSHGRGIRTMNWLLLPRLREICDTIVCVL